MFGRSQGEKDGALKTALEEGDIVAARRALDKGADPKAVFDYYKQTPLHLAASNSNQAAAEEAVALLLPLGVDVNALDTYGRTPLDYALTPSSGHVSVVKALLEAGASCTAGSYRESALVSAISNGFWGGAEYLLALKPELALVNRDPTPPLALAIARGAPRSLVDKLLAVPVDVNAGTGGNSALHAAAAGNREYVELLLARPGIKVNGAGAEDRTPLMVAVRQGSDEIVEALLRAGADVNRGTAEEGSPLTNALRNNKDSVALQLVEAGAVAGYADNDGKTALVLAVESEKTDLVKALLEARAKSAGTDKLVPEKPPGNGAPAESPPWRGAKRVAAPDDLLTALFAAVGKGQPRLVELIAAAGPDLGGTDAEGYTPLTRAAAAGKVEALNVLLKAGANPEETDLRGKSAYNSAEGWQCEEAKKFLARYRRQLEKKTVAPPPPKDGDRFRLLAPDMLEVNQGGLKTVFNFWTQQMIVFRGAGNDAPMVVQNFSDVQRQEAVEEAWRKLKALGGNPPEIPQTALQKKPSGLGKG